MSLSAEIRDISSSARTPVSLSIESDAKATALRVVMFTSGQGYLAIFRCLRNELQDAVNLTPNKLDICICTML